MHYNSVQKKFVLSVLDPIYTEDSRNKRNGCLSNTSNQISINSSFLKKIILLYTSQVDWTFKKIVFFIDCLINLVLKCSGE